MMFEGSKNVGAEAHFRYLEAAGASEINGTTDFDRTNYFETLPSNQLELALWLESDRMGFLLEKLDAAKLANQRDVVRNERRQSIENAPYGLVEEAMFHTLFPKNHPYYASVIGSHADIEAARLPDVREFFRLYYAPNNASLAIVGDIEPAGAKELVEKYFGPIPSGPPIPEIDVLQSRITSERKVVVGDQVELPRIYLAWLTPAIFQPGDAECDLAAKILGGGKASRLYKSLVYEQRIAQDVGAMQYSLALGSIFSIQATAKPDVAVEDLESAIDRELEAFCDQGPTPSELEGARNTIETAVIRGLETLGGFGGVADRLNMYNHFLADPGYLASDLARIRNATVDSVKELARKELSVDKRVVVHGIPGKKEITDVPKSKVEEDEPKDTSPPTISGQEWRGQPPQAGPPSGLKLPTPETAVLPNGLRIFLIEQRGLPIVSANIMVMSGSECNPQDRPGLASFTTEMLDEGTKTRSAMQIAEGADLLGASLTTGSSTDYSFVAFRTLKRNIDAAFELGADLLLRPSFPEPEIDRIRHDRLTELMRQRENPNALAGKFFIQALYREDHPYGTIELGTESSLEAMSRKDLSEFWSKGFTPDRAALVLAGDIALAELVEVAQKHLGEWSGLGGDFTLPPVEPSRSPRIILIDKPESPQTVLRVGHVGAERSNPDYVPIDVMNTALGGLFSSRINMNLREEHGYTYGASSVFVFRRGPGPFLVGTSVQTEVTAAAVAEIIKEVKRMREDLPSPEELAIAKDSIARSLPGLFETTPQAASSTGQLFVYDLPLDYYRTLPGQVDGVGAEDIRRVAQHYLKPDQLVVVAVGDRSQIAPDLAKLGFAEVEAYDAEGMPLA
jgi:zinc protease